MICETLIRAMHGYKAACWSVFNDIPEKKKRLKFPCRQETECENRSLSLLSRKNGDDKLRQQTKEEKEPTTCSATGDSRPVSVNDGEIVIYRPALALFCLSRWPPDQPPDGKRS